MLDELEVDNDDTLEFADFSSQCLISFVLDSSTLQPQYMPGLRKRCEEV